MRKLLSRFHERLIAVEKAVCALLMAGVMLAALWGIFERFVWRGGMGVSDELARYLNVYCIFLGAALGVVKGAHVGVDVFVRLVPAKFHRTLTILSYTISGVLCAVIACTGFSYFLRLMASGQITPALRLPICLVFLAVPLGSALMCLHFVLRLTTGDIETPALLPSGMGGEKHND
ncbi:MAG: TRAP transporter small permease [Deltaproteobacteria bacterium]|nr:TRAP transporter small permease [Deltaproteobacteria bacterium]